MSTDANAKTLQFNLKSRPADVVAWQYRVAGQLKPTWLEALECVGKVAVKGAPVEHLFKRYGNTAIRYDLGDWVLLKRDGEINVMPDAFFANQYEAASV